MREGKITITWEQKGKVCEIYVIMNSICLAKHKKYQAIKFQDRSQKGLKEES